MTTKEIMQLFYKAKCNWTYISKLQEFEIEGMMQLWKEFLKDVPYEIANKALNEHILKQGTFFPTIADLVKNIVTTDEEIISEAVSKFRQCLKKGGSIETDDRRLVWTIKRMGGWDRCRNSNLDQVNFLVNEFQKVYTELLKREVPEEIDFFLITNSHRISQEQGLFFPVSKVKSEKVNKNCVNLLQM